MANGGTGLDLSSLTKGSIWYDNGTNGFTRLVPGTAGYFLMSNGTGADSSYVDISETKCSFLVRSTGNGTFDETGGYDTSGDFASNTFTAPVDGRYLLSYTQQFTATTNSRNSVASATMGGKTAYTAAYQNQASGSYRMSATVTVILDLSATNTVTASYNLSEGEAAAGVVNSNIAVSFWSGVLIRED